MKHNYSVAVLIAAFTLIAGNLALAQSVTYYLPKTQLVLDVEYECVETQQGPFYQYSERYLGTKDIVMENATKYQVVGVKIHSNSIADHSHAYTFVAGEQGIRRFCLSKEGLLLSINAQPASEVAAPVCKKHKAETDNEGKTEIAEVMPLLEEQMLATSVARMAEGTAKQIYHIRESRLNILSGDVDKMPADGKSTQLILKELKRQEEQLTALFVGKTTTTVMHRRIVVEVEECSEKVAFRFSSLQGVLPADDLSGEPFYLTIKSTYSPSPVVLAKAPVASPVYYVEPGEVVVSLTDGTQNIAETTVRATQMGYVNYIPANLLLKQAASVIFSEKTGLLLSVE